MSMTKKCLHPNASRKENANSAAPKRKRAARRALCAAAALFMMGSALPVSALTYTDTENKFRLEIPESDATYYFTPQSTNLFEDLLEQVKNSGRDIRLLVRTYTPADMLGYSLEVAADDLPGDAAGTDGISYQDIQLLPADEQAGLTASVRKTYEGRFNLSEPYPAQLQGLPSLRMNGTGVSDTGWGQYDCEVYLLATDRHILTITLITEAPGLYSAAELTQEGKDLLQSMVIGEAALTAPSPTADPEPSQTQPPVPAAVSPVPANAETLQPAEPSSARSFGTWLQDMWEHNRLFMIGLIAGLGAVIALIAVLCMRHAKPERRAGSQTGAAYTVDDSGSAPRIARHEEAPQQAQSPPVLRLESAPPTGDTRINQRPRSENAVLSADSRPIILGESQTDSSQVVEKVYDTYDGEAGGSPAINITESRKEDDMVASGGYNGQDYDFAEDISRYTQQPGPDVNDVSRYTHGYGAQDHGLRQLGDSPYTTPGSVSRPTVGSRVERNKAKRRRSK